MFTTGKLPVVLSICEVTLATVDCLGKPKSCSNNVRVSSRSAHVDPEFGFKFKDRRSKMFFKKKKFDISQTCIDGTMFCKETQCMQMMQLIYKILTDRKWPFSVVSPISDDLCDYDYQMRLPLHAQSTATKSVKNNIMFTELLVYPNQLLNARKAQKIIDRHMELRLKKRVEDPERFHVHPTLGQQTVRQQNIVAHKEDVEKAPLKKAVSDSINDMNVRFKDIKLKQPFITQLQ
ncbi:spermatogenesis-associated protein 4 isoform X2 [Octopus bimaculoides]|uniref:spermatogenesis-associated protein 4 isoform X2 n=1 Tax=Octopus bimaculoides TaxID=37653 RepID=UPI00071C8C1F|nr:spermatogenesis-associated protein 4 isoform X2 [Octopus bimaculoides]|eukprot:XP_014790864.1 PREDICTED: spermatogenesis-associated protein 4-like isoform X2 [Octopus bimaculoides]